MTEPLLRYRLAARERYAPGGPVALEFSLHNGGAQDAWVLAWRTPLEGLCGRILRVQCHGADLAYRGRLVKRADPAADDYRCVPAGGGLAARFDLAEGYELPAGAVCRVAFPGPLLDVIVLPAGSPAPAARPLAEHRPLAIVGDAASVRIDA